MCHSKEGKSQRKGGLDRPFLCAPYVTGAGGRLRPVEGIERCPLAPGDQVCELEQHSFRSRKTGPRFPLRIMHCVRHKVYFTVYPPGHVPYSRQAVAPVDERGRVATPEHEAACWRATLFDAALDAANGERWLHEAVLGDPVTPRYTTQRRWLERAGRILGLSTTGRRSEQIAEELDLMVLEHHPARQRFQTRSLEERGAAVVSVLDQLRLDSGLWQRLLIAGYQGRAWARPWVWSPQVGRLLSPWSQVARAVRGPPTANEIRSFVG